MPLQVGHVAIRCRDLEVSLRFYRDVLGLPEAFRMSRPDGTVGLVYLYVTAASFIELLVGGETERARSRDVIGYDHVCLIYDDLRAALTEMVNRGLELSGEPVIRPDGNLKYWMTDPDGNQVELTQILPGSLQARAAARAWSEPT